MPKSRRIRGAPARRLDASTRASGSKTLLRTSYQTGWDGAATPSARPHPNILRRRAESSCWRLQYSGSSCAHRDRQRQRPARVANRPATCQQPPRLLMFFGATPSNPTPAAGPSQFLSAWQPIPGGLRGLRYNHRLPPTKATHCDHVQPRLLALDFDVEVETPGPLTIISL